MTRMKGIFATSLRRAFASKLFAASVVVTVAMCYISSREFLTGSNNSVYIIDVMIHLGLFKKIIVFCAAIPFATVYCQDSNSGYIKSLIVRSSERAYVWTNVAVCALSGFAAVFAGMLVFFGIVSVWLPPAAYEAGGVYDSLAVNHPMVYVLMIVGVFAAYAAMWTVVGLALSSLLPDRYVALGSPVIFGYLLEELTQGLPPYLNLYSLSHSYDVFRNALGNCLYTVGVFVLMAAAAGCLFSVFVKRRSRNEMA